MYIKGACVYFSMRQRPQREPMLPTMGDPSIYHLTLSTECDIYSLLYKNNTLRSTVKPL